MTRPTSAAAYRAVIDSGLLNAQQHRAFDALYSYSNGVTGRELERAIGSTDGHKRLTELRDMGIAEELEPRRCQVSGHRAIVWRARAVPDPHPLPKKPKRPSKETLRAALAHYTLRDAGGRDPAVDATLTWLERISRERP